LSASDETGRYEIYVRSFPDGGAKRGVSTDGGIEPKWSPRGDEIFFWKDESGFVDRSSLMVVSVTGDDLEPRFGAPRQLLEGIYESGVCCGHSCDVTRDGQRFVMITGAERSGQRMSVVLGALGGLQGE